MKIEITWKRALAAGVIVFIGAPVLFVAWVTVKVRLNPPEPRAFMSEDRAPDFCPAVMKGNWLALDETARILGDMHIDSEIITWRNAGVFEAPSYVNAHSRSYSELAQTEQSVMPLGGLFIHEVRRPRRFFREFDAYPCAAAIVICPRLDWILEHTFTRGRRDLRKEGVFCHHAMYRPEPRSK